jgi:putative chitinase
MITADQLIAAGIAPTQARAFVQPLIVAMARFDITTPARAAAFVGQCMVESGRFVHTEENLYYSSPERIAQVWPSLFRTAGAAAAYAKSPVKLGSKVYAGRNGNGDEASGDGYRYRGRGLLQMTGREHYADAATELAHPYLENPDLVAQPADACLTAAWFWHTHKLNTLADVGAVDEITRAINGRAMLEAPLRRQYTQQALAAWDAQAPTI